MKENEKIPYLDHGYVQLIDHMGSDARVCESARCSYGKEERQATDKENRGLLRYLLKNLHTSPFEQNSVTFRLKIPLFVQAQLIRHRTAKVNQISARYTQLPKEYYLPKELMKQSTDNKQGRSEEKVEGEDKLLEMMDFSMEHTYDLYDQLVTDGVSKEISRIVLPQSMYTVLYWTMDLHNLLHFLELRLHKHAMEEIRILAEIILEVIRSLFPETIDAFEEYILGAVTFSRSERIILDDIINALSSEDLNYLLENVEEKARKEFKQKLGFME